MVGSSLRADLSRSSYRSSWKDFSLTIVVWGALGIKPEVGFHVLEAEKLVLPELGVELEGNDIGAFDVQVEGIAEVKDQLAADVHGPKEVGGFCQAIAGDLPQKGRIFLLGVLPGLLGMKPGRDSIWLPAHKT